MPASRIRSAPRRNGAVLAVTISVGLASTLTWAAGQLDARTPPWTRKIPGQPQQRFVSPSSDIATEDVTVADVTTLERRLAALGDVEVGQAAGRAILASDVLQPRVRAIAAAAARDASRAVIDQQIVSIVRSSLQQELLDALFAAEAMDALDDEQREAMAAWANERRESLVMEYGNGDADAADAALRTIEDGRGLEDLVETQRQQAVQQRHLVQLFGDDLTIDIADVRRFHARNIDRFTVPTERVARMIQTTEDAAADRIDAALRGGVPFAEVAATEDNMFHRESGGRIPGNLIGHDTLISPLNEALLALETGQHSPRITHRTWHTWLALVELTPGRIVPVEEVREEIEQEIRSGRYATLFGDYTKALLERGDHTPVDTMVKRTMRVVHEIVD